MPRTARRLEERRPTGWKEGGTWQLGAVLLATLILAACGPATPPAPPPLPSPAPPVAAPSAHYSNSPAAAAAPALLKEDWDVILLEGHKVGYSHTRMREVRQENQEAIELTSEYELTMQRFDQTVTQRIEVTSVETPDGQVLRFSTRLVSGPSDIRIEGHYRDGQMEITTQTLGKTIPSKLAWQPSYRGPFAELQSLRKQPMQPGEIRQLQALVPGTAQVGEIELAAKTVEPVRLLDETRELLRIEARTRLAGTEIRSVLWTDHHGEPLKTVSLLGIQPESYRTTREVALAAVPPRTFDLGARTVVKITGPLPSPHATQRIVYRARLAHGSPSKTFANGPTQRTREIDERTAEITVRALRPGAPSDPDFAAPQPPTDADRHSNNLIQSDHPAIVQLAGRIAPQETVPWAIAKALERHVRDYVTTRSLSQAMASAGDVVESREGDCTEHAVLLAALCRARGIPARAAIGLVYYGPQQGFAYHMWNEVWIEDQWIPLDSTLGLGGIGAAHLKIGDSHLASASPVTELLPVIEVLGQLELEVLSVDGPAP